MLKVFARWWWAALGAGCLLVAALPALLLWNVVRPLPWDRQTLRVRFESVQYRGAALIFTYSVENRAWRSLRLVPEQTDIRLVASGTQVPGGFPSFQPMLLEGHAIERVELRIDLPAEPEPAGRQEPPGENPGSVLERDAPGITAAGRLVSRLPIGGPPAAAKPPLEIPKPDDLVEDALRNLDGFELVNQAKGVRLLFPRGW